MFATIRFYNQDKGWGFATPDNGDKDVFIHRSELEKSRITVLEGDRIEFEIKEGNRGPVAIDIKLVPVAR